MTSSTFLMTCAAALSQKLSYNKGRSGCQHLRGEILSKRLVLSIMMIGVLAYSHSAFGQTAQPLPDNNASYSRSSSTASRRKGSSLSKTKPSKATPAHLRSTMSRSINPQVVGRALNRRRECGCSMLNRHDRLHTHTSSPRYTSRPLPVPSIATMRTVIIRMVFIHMPTTRTAIIRTSSARDSVLDSGSGIVHRSS